MLGTYIDTLTLSVRFKEQIDADGYLFFLSQQSESLGKSNGYEWYRLEDNTRVGYLGWEDASKRNFPHLQIQFSWGELFSATAITNRNLDFTSEALFVLIWQKLEYLVLPEDERIDVNIKRIDFSVLSEMDEVPANYITTYKKRGYIYNGKKLETAYLGNRSSGSLVRIYDKYKELHDKESWVKMDTMSEKFGEPNSSWVVIENEIHRKKLRTIEGCSGVSYDNIYCILNYQNTILQGILYFAGTENNINNYKNNHYDLIDSYQLVDDNVILKQFERKFSLTKPSAEHLKSTVKKKIISYVEKVGGGEDLYIYLLQDILEDFDIKIKSVQFTEDEAEEKFYQYLEEKRDLGSVFVLESKKYFGKINKNKKG